MKGKYKIDRPIIGACLLLFDGPVAENSCGLAASTATLATDKALTASIPDR